MRLKSGEDPEINPFPRNQDGFLRPPSLAELGVHPGTLEVAEEIAGLSELPGLGQSVLERLVAAVVLSDRVLCPDVVIRAVHACSVAIDDGSAAHEP